MAQAGDRAAMEALLRRHYDRINALCRRITGSEADGADATQEALIAVVKGLPRFDGRGNSTWAYRGAATNVCLDELRRKRRRPVTSFGDGDQAVAEPMDDVPLLDDRVGDRSTSTPHSRSCPRTSAPLSCCAMCASSITPRSPRCWASAAAPCDPGSPGRAAVAAMLSESWNPDPPPQRPSGQR